MPVLPSGRRFGLARSHILEPGTQWFECPEGHFWYQTPDLAINAPPFHPEQQVVCDFVHAPCPTTVAEAERFVVIVELFGERGTVLTGMTLDRRQRPDGWSEADWLAWDSWRQTADVRAFVQATMDMCRAQADANIGLGGPVTLRAASGDAPEEVRVRERAARDRAVAMVREIQEIGAELGDHGRASDRAFLGALQDRALALRQELHALVDDPMHAPIAEAWHALGMVSRLLDLPEESERAFVEASRLAPFELQVWLELTRIRGERGDDEGAETAARRAVELDPVLSQPWANLAMVLLKRGRLEECREAVGRALEIDADDHVARYVDGHLRSRSRHHPEPPSDS